MSFILNVGGYVCLY